MAKTTRTKNSQVTWNGAGVRLVIEEATQETLTKAAFQIKAQTAVNITVNENVDTGFMRESIYVITPDESGYQAAGEAGEKAVAKKAQETGYNYQRDMAPEVTLPAGDDPAAGVAIGAEYGVYREIINPALYPAMEQVAQEFGGELVKTAKQKGL